MKRNKKKYVCVICNEVEVQRKIVDIQIECESKHETNCIAELFWPPVSHPIDVMGEGLPNKFVICEINH